MNEYKKKIKIFLAVSIIILGRLFASITFSDGNARFILKDWRSKIGITPSSVSGWRDSSIVPKVSGVGLGDYDLTQYDYNMDNSITYSDLGNNMGAVDWNIPANTSVHIRENIYMDGYGGTINLGENSQLFVDDNVTLTLRNVTVKSRKNGVGNPAIKLASTRSQLVLDNAKLDFANDFYFDRGHLFAYNDVNFTGTSAFIYRSTVPSYIKSGANLKFNPGTIFDFRPSSTGIPGLLAKDLLAMDDATSKITFDGSALEATLTGMRLTKGQVIFDNKVSLTSQSQFRLTGTGTWDYKSYGTYVYSVNWSPDGRFLAVGGRTPTSTYEIQVYSFNGTTLSASPVSSVDFGTYVWSVNWSPDGKYLAVGGQTPTDLVNEIQIYSFNGSTLSASPVSAADYGTAVYSVNWSPDGRYLAVGGNVPTSGNEIQVYKFTGSALSLVAAQNYGSTVNSVNWSPDGRYLAVGGMTPTSGNEIQVYMFTGSALSLVASRDYGSTVPSVNWSPDGRFLAVGGQTPIAGHDEIDIYGFDGNKLTYILSKNYGGYVRAVNWSPDGRYLAVGGNTPASGLETQLYEFTGSALQYVSAVNFGTTVYSVNWRSDGKYLAIGGLSPASGHDEIEVYTLQFSPETQRQNIANSIVFGNSSLQPRALSTKLTSTHDLTVKLLSGANVSVDGILNIDNSSTNTNSVQFAGDNSRFVLKDWKSKIRSNLNSMQGWRDSSIVPNVSGIGLSDYNLKQYDYVPDNTLTYSEVINSMQFTDWNIPANTAVHIQENIYMDGYGGTINLGENSQLFVDDNVTLTLRNVTVKSSKNGVGNPAIKLASTRSQLALDNATLNFASDFYFDRGHLFAYNDVNFTGTSAFIYRSTVPSYIKSGANLKFNNGTTFDFRPSTTGTPGMLAKDLLIMDDATSKITLDGASLKTTLTGLRLTEGQILFDNKISMTSQSQLRLTGTGTWINSPYGTQVNSVNWSPDGRFLAVGGNVPASGGEIQVYRFTGSELSFADSKGYGQYAWSVNWSPDGRYLAVGGGTPTSGNEIQIYGFNGSVLSLIDSKNYGTFVYSVNWSPDGKYLAVGGSNSTAGNDLQVYRFTGTALHLVASQDYGNFVISLNWSPDGRYLAVGGGTPTSGNEIQVYNFTGTALSLVASRDYGSGVWSVNWSPDGKFLAVGGDTPNAGHDEIDIYGFDGNKLTYILSKNYGNNVSSVVNSLNWSPDGRYLAVGGFVPSSGLEIQLYAFTGLALRYVGAVNFGGMVYSVNWSSDGRFLAVGGKSPASGHAEIEVYTLQYGPETQRQNIANSIVFGNSALQPLSLNTKITSSHDLTVKLLSGANVSVDGILNIDNTQTNTNSIIFCNDNARFVLNNSNSKIRSNLNSMQGWRDSSIVPNVSGIGLGDYNLAQYDYNMDNLITYSDVSNNMGAVDWNIPANTAVHIQENIYMDGYGGTINLGENSQLFVDDNVTLTLRNVIVKSAKNGIGNPAIKLASNRSQLVLDNAKLDFANDFYFDRGKLFAYNDVNFTGTNSFIYRSTVPSYIKSGANLKFNQSTAFDFRPSSTGIPGLLAKDLLMMDDATSRITFDGATLKTTLTGLRLTKGQILMDNKVSLTSAAVLKLLSTTTTVTNWIFGNGAFAVNWSPDGRYLAVGGYNTSTDLKIFRFIGSNFAELTGCSKDFTTYVNSLNWSPDGRFLAVAVDNDTPNLRIYNFSQETLSEIPGCATTFVFPHSVCWSPDGKYLAVGGANGTTDLKVYAFSGMSLVEIPGCTKDFGSVNSLNWSPDGRYLAVGGVNGTTDLMVYSFVGTALTALSGCSKDFSSGVNVVSWSPDGRSLAVGGSNGTADLKVYSFTGTSLADLPGCSKDFATSVNAVKWSPDGKYLAIGGLNFGADWYVYLFNGSSLTQIISSTSFSSTVKSIDWSNDSSYLAIGGIDTSADLQVWRLDYGRETLTQATSNSIVFGNAAAGSASDVTLKLLSSANVLVDGIMNYDNTQGYTIFSSDNSRFLLKDSNSKIRMNPNTVIGWRDRSLVKNMTGVGQGDYNLINYDSVPPTDIIGYAEAPSELVYDNSNAVILRANLPSAITLLPRYNSNAITYLTPQVRTYSNALMSWPRQTSNVINSIWRPVVGNSNSIVSWIKQTSNVAVGLNNSIRWNSNAIVIGATNNSNAVVKLSRDSKNNSNAVVFQDRRIRDNSNAIKFESDHFISVNGAKVTALGGITGTTNVTGRGFLSSPIDLQGGTLTLNSDMILSNQSTIVSSGNFDLQGNSMIFGGDLMLPTNVAIKIISSGVLDGQGNEFKNAIGARLVVDNNVSLTLRNMNWTAAGSPQIEMRDASSILTLQNLSTKFDRDYSFTQGQLFIQDDVFVTGTNKFSYVSTTTSYVMSHSTLYFDKNTTFSYSPRLTKRHTRSERNLIKLLDKTAEIYFDECTLQLPDSGWQLTKGTIYFDNKVPVYAGTTQADSFEWGSGVIADDLEIVVLAGGVIDNFGYVYHNPGN